MAPSFPTSVRASAYKLPEKRDASEEPIIAEGASGNQSDHEKGETVDQMIERGCFPVVESSGCLKPTGQPVRTEGAESDSEEDHERGETNSRGGCHRRKGRVPRRMI